MEDRGNKTIICSVLFLDIVEYSKKSVAGQISLKDRFNTYLSEAIHDVPVTDRIILDTGDGAAVNFLGDVEAALTAALRLRESLLEEDPALEPPLLVRIGINLGPVRLVRDINGQPNIVGDGINVAQRVMGFADASQILVSRSYYDAVSRLSPQYSGMFHYQGSRTDKHVREHEIYAIGYPGDQTTRQNPVAVEADASSGSTGTSGQGGVASLTEKFRQASLSQRIVYAAIPAVALLAVVLALLPKKPVENLPVVETLQSAQPAASAVVAPASSVTAKETQHAPVAKNAAEKPAGKTTGKPTDKAVHAETDKSRHKPEPVAGKKSTSKSSDAQTQNSESAAGKSAAAADSPEAVKDAYLSVSCKEGAQLFLDGIQKGRIGSDALTVKSKPGKQKIIIMHPSFGIYSADVVLEPGKTRSIRPKECN